MSKNKLVIFDADSMIFTVAWQFKTKKSSKLVEIHTNKFITDVMANSGATHFIGFFGSKEEDAKPNFRFDVYDKYKAQRPPTPDFVIKWRPTIHNVFKEKWGFVPVSGMEADDAVAIAANQYKNDYEIIIATFDKDLRQIPNSTFYNMKKHESEYISEFEANKAFYLQLLKGDTSDNIPGLRGIGSKKAENILKDITTVTGLRTRVIRTYAEIEDSIKVQALKKVTEEVTALVEGDDCPEDLKKLRSSKPRLERHVRIASQKQINEAIQQVLPGGWKGYYKQQYQLLRMLTECPADFIIPTPKEAPIKTIIPGSEVKSSTGNIKIVDSFLTI